MMETCMKNCVISSCVYVDYPVNVITFPLLFFVFIYQLSKENQGISILPQVKINDNEVITEDNVATTLRRALSFYSTLQNNDGHWAGDYGGPMFLMPGMVNVSIAATSCLTLKDTFNVLCCRIGS